MTPIDPQDLKDLLPFVNGYHTSILPVHPVIDYRQLERHLQDIAGPFVAVMELYDSQGNWQPHLHVITSAVPPLSLPSSRYNISSKDIQDKVHADNIHTYLRKQRSSLYYSSSTSVEEVRAEVVVEEEPVLAPFQALGDLIPTSVVFPPYANRESPIRGKKQGIVFLFFIADISVRPP